MNERLQEVENDPSIDEIMLIDDEDEVFFTNSYGESDYGDIANSDSSNNSSDAVSIRETTHSIDVWDDLAAGVFNDDQGFVFNGVQYSGQSILRPCNAVEAPLYTPESNFQINRRRGRTGVDEKFAEDLEGHELACYLSLAQGLKDCFHEAASKKNREIALEWAMCLSDPDGITFDDCCNVLGVRPNILLLRLHYQFFLKRTVFEKDFGFMVKKVPFEIEPEIEYYTTGGLSMARRMWCQPGLDFNEVAQNQEDVEVLNRMIELGYACENGKAMYLTGRNPLKSNVRKPWRSLF